MTVGMMDWGSKKPQQPRPDRTGATSGIGVYIDMRADIKEQRKQENQRLIDEARHVDLVQLIGRYSQLRRQGPQEWAGPCPACGGEDRLRVTPTGWFCRQCKPYEENTGWYGSIDWVMWRHNLDFKTAVGFLTGAQMTAAVQQRAPAPARPERMEPDDQWRAKAAGIVAETQHALFHADLDGAEYLELRGLEPGTWRAFGWGFGPGWYSLTRQLLPAIVIPWYRGGRIMAIRYRFLNPPAVVVEGKERVEKIVSLKGSHFGGILYGGQAMEPGAEQTRTLVLCEGEINAASIWQVAHETRLDVLSVGSESTRLTDPMLAHAAKYKQVVVWMDRREIADKMRQQLADGGSAGTVAVSSPLRKDDQGNVLTGADGKPQKWDANDLLRIGKLGAFLAGVRVKACGEDGRRREGLLWDLVDAARLPLGIDPGTGAVAWKLAGELGKTVNMYRCPDGAWRVGE